MGANQTFERNDNGVALVATAANEERKRDSQPSASANESETMEQVRELLFGAALRELEERIIARLERLEARLEEVARTSSEAQKTALDELAAGVKALSAHIEKARTR